MAHKGHLFTEDGVVSAVKTLLGKYETIVIEREKKPRKHWSIWATDLPIVEVEPQLKGEPSPYGAHENVNG